MWVRLKTIQHIERNGKNVTYHAGDWIDVGKQTAMLWLSRGDAEIPAFKHEAFMSGQAGVIIRGVAAVEPFYERFNAMKLNLTLIAGDPYLAFERTLCWNPKALLRMELVGAGFGFLDTWEIAAPLYSYDELAVHIGSDEARERTKSVVRDLRIPVVDVRLLYVRHCESTTDLFEQWGKENESGDDERLTFMRAYYKVKPLALMLPVSWTNPAIYAEVA